MLIIVMGKTNCGKDSVIKYLKEKYNIPDLVSYATRPMRAYEVNGVQHWFISKEEIDRIKETEDLIAWTINDKTGIEYCSTAQAMTAETCTYALNPHGLDWGLSEGKLKVIPHVVLYVECDEDVIIERGKARGDDFETLMKRLNSERDEFNRFRDQKRYDYIINNDGTKEELLQKVDVFCEKLGLKA